MFLRKLRSKYINQSDWLFAQKQWASKAHFRLKQFVRVIITSLIEYHMILVKSYTSNKNFYLFRVPFILLFTYFLIELMIWDWRFILNVKIHNWVLTLSWTRKANIPFSGIFFTYVFMQKFYCFYFPWVNF